MAVSLSSAQFSVARSGLGRRRRGSGLGRLWRGSGDGGGLRLGEAAVLGLARRSLGVLLPAAHGAGLGALGLDPVLLLVGTLLVVAAEQCSRAASALEFMPIFFGIAGPLPRVATGGAAWGWCDGWMGQSKCNLDFAM